MHGSTPCRGTSAPASMKALPKRKGNVWVQREGLEVVQRASMKALPKRKGNTLAIMAAVACGLASMKALPKRKGNSHPKLARNHAAETGTPREPRGRPHKKYTQTSLHAPKHP